MQSEDSRRIDQDVISFEEIFRILWGGRWLIIAITLAFTLIAAAAAWRAPRKYEANVIISPVSSASGEQLGTLGSLASQLGGLASLAGISVTADAKKAESLAVLESEALTSAYIRENQLLPVLYAESWDAGTGKWRTVDPKRVPTLWKANQYFKKKIRKVSLDTPDGLVTLSITWTDPELAAKWANELVAKTNDYLRAKAIRESEANIKYLNQEAARTEIVGARQAIYSILQNEINKAMLARGNAEYAFKVLDPATRPETPSSPQTLIWIAAGFLAGAFLSVCLVFFRLGRRRDASASA
jgi:uncharacterized protein involved in exopolysaccharide biosynthesis